MTKSIFDHNPGTWQELEEMVRQAFQEMGYGVERNYEVYTVRGKVKIDVYAVNEKTPIPTIVLCECKHWNKPVEQSVVYSFRTICADIGAHYGLIISKKGFQSGAEKTRESTNIHLLDFVQFQETFFNEWKQGVYMSFAKMGAKLVHLMPGNPNSIIDSSLLCKYEPSYLFEKYSIFFGSNYYISYFLGDENFPIEVIDPRGDPNNSNKIIISSHREYFEISKEAYKNVCEYFNI
jgi:hypothetical protein